MKVADAIKTMETWASPSLMDSWDNGGLIFGSYKRELQGILLTLDVTESVIQYAVNKGLNLIISHHPIIFKPLKELSLDGYNGRVASLIIKNDINIYCSHTNLDAAIGGVSDVLADKLGIKQCIPLVPGFTMQEGVKTGYGRVGIIEPVDIEDFIKIIKERLNLKSVVVYGKIETLITRAAVCGGSGGDFVKEAVCAGAQIYITGDVKYHEAQMAVELGLVLVDAGHYNTERPILDTMATKFNYVEDENIKLEVYPEMPFAVTYYC